MSETHAAATTQPSGIITAEELTATAVEAYVFGYPLVLMDAARGVAATAGDDGGGVGAGGAGALPRVNRLTHTRRFPDHRCQDVAWPDADALYSTALLDLRQRPLVLSAPEMAGRYHVIQVVDGWTNVFASLGSRTTGGRARHFALVGPDWLGVLPTSLERIDLPTNMVWLIGRTYAAGPTDYHAVHVLQDQMRLRTLAQWGRAAMGDGLDESTPRPEPEPDARPPVERVAALDARTFFSRLAALMMANPPAPEDRPLLERAARIGLRPGRVFVPDAQGPGAARLLADAVRGGQRLIAGGPAELARLVNGWRIGTNGGRYGTSYLLRAAAACERLGAADLPDDVVRATADLDEAGQPLDGRRAYEIRFARGALPPVHGFWSLSLYGADHRFVENPIGRHALSDRHPLRVEGDGSVTVYLQHDPPEAERRGSWLPTPEGPFSLMLRCYWPQLPILEGRWAPPGVRPAAV